MMQLLTQAVHSTHTRPAGRAPTRRHRQLLQFVTLGCCLHSLLLQAQSAEDLRYLLFDPVPITVSSTPDGALLVEELASPPKDAPIELRQWLETNRPAIPQPGESQEDSIKRNEQLVQEIETNDGPFSEQLPQQLLSLGTALQASGDFEKAQDYFEQAMHVTRINHGLFSEAQIPFVKFSIDNHLRQGNLWAADEQQRYLFYLNQKNHGDDSAALLPALEDFAEWNIFAFSAPVSTPALSLSNEGDAAKSAPADEAMFRVERLINAQNIYWSIAQILVANFGMTDPRLLDTEKRIALTNYFFATTIATDADTLNLSTANMPAPPATGVGSAPMLGNMGYRQGRDALERRRNYMQEMDGFPAEERLRASLDLIDWMLYFSRQRMKAIEMYEQNSLDFAASMPPEALAAVLNPPLPEQLPSFIKPSWSRAALGLPEDQALQYKGHIDVEFNLNRFGKTTTASVLGRSNPEARLVEQRLLRSLRRAQFRPRFENGTLKLSDTVTARFYYTW